GLFLDVANVDYDDDIERDDEVLFSESLGRLLVEPHPEHEDDFVNFLTRLNVPIRQVGRTVTEPVLVADGITGDRVLEITNADLERAWSTPLARGPLAFGTGAST
ncbi:MAG: AIR synthase-related protein, partial [Planctomycetota bacterium]|nr:AIR synthase-related protein [Planctomycetota bacterium]